MSQEDRHSQRVADTVFSNAAPAKSALAASWRRSLVVHGLDPATREIRATEEKRALLQRVAKLGYLLEITQPNLDHLFQLVGKSGCGVVLTDKDGIILDHRYSTADARAFEGWGLRIGADWSEAAEGTNGIGTCLTEERRVVIHRDEHFMTKNTAMSCIDAPIFGAGGELIAALDVSSARADQTQGFNELISAMVVQTARKIEMENFKRTFASARIVVADFDGAESAVLCAVDTDDIVIGATRGARKAFGLSPSGAFEPFPASDIFGRVAGPTGFEKAERAAVVRALARAKGNVSGAARALGISRATMYRRMKRHGLDD